MNLLFQTKVRYSKVLESGKEKKVTENYLLDAVSFSDAEERINKEMEPYISGEFSISGISISRIGEVLKSEGQVNYKAKVTFITLDEEKGVEKRASTYILVAADNVAEANQFVNESFKDCVSDYEISGITDSGIIDYFPIV